MPEAFDAQALHLLGSKPTRGDDWRSELFGRLREAVEVTALRRGVERWTPKRELEEVPSVEPCPSRQSMNFSPRLPRAAPAG